MEEIELNNSMYRQIYENAHKLFLDKSGKEFNSYENFLCYCITNSLISFAAAKDWIIKDGKIYQNSSKETKS